MEFDFLLKVILRHKWIILICMALAFLVSFFLTKNLKKTYKSVAQISTGFTESDMPGVNNVVNYTQSELNFNNARENITSLRLLSLVAYRMLLHDLQSQAPFKPLGTIAVPKDTAIQILQDRIEKSTLLSPAIPNEKVLLNLLESKGYDAGSVSKVLQVERYLKSDYLNVQYISENADMSAFIVNAVCSEFIRTYSSREQQRSTLSISTLDSLVNRKRAVLEEKQAAKNLYATSRGLIDAGVEGTNVLNQISAFENSLIIEQGVRKNQSYRVTQLTDLINKAQSQGLTTVDAPTQNNNEYLRLKKLYDNLQSEYISKGGTDQDLKNRIDEVSSQIQQLNFGAGTTAVEAVSVQDLVQARIDAQALLEGANQRISSLERNISRLKGGLSDMAATSATVQQYDKEIEIARNEYNLVKEQLDAALNFSETRSENIRQTLVGQPALKAEASKRLMIIAASVLGTALFTTFAICLIALFDQTYKTPSRFLSLTKLPLIGTVNVIKIKNKILDTVAEQSDHEKRDNTFMEMLRKLRYEMESGGKRTILFSSMKPQQGKTTLVQALAYIFSLGKKSVLILDTNFCDNELTKLNDAQRVLEKLDMDKISIDDNFFQQYINKTSVEGVDIIGCGGGDFTPTEILPKNHLLKHLDKLKDKYDFVLLEGAPLNEFADTKELLPFVDGLIVVFSSEANFTAADQESINFLQENKDKFIGAILNKVEKNNLEL